MASLSTPHSRWRTRRRGPFSSLHGPRPGTSFELQRTILRLYWQLFSKPTPPRTPEYTGIFSKSPTSFRQNSRPGSYQVLKGGSPPTMGDRSSLTVFGTSWSVLLRVVKVRPRSPSLARYSPYLLARRNRSRY